MNTERWTALAGRAGWALALIALAALCMLWHFDRTHAWESPRWDDRALVVLRSSEPADARPEPLGGREVAGGERGVPPLETWVVAVNPRCEMCRASLARALALQRAAGARVQCAALVVDTVQRPDAATVLSLGADELRWDSTGVWRHRWGHRVYGEILCFDRAGRFVRTLPPLADSLAARFALRVAAALERGGGS
jgi:hypothetical protein